VEPYRAMANDPYYDDVDRLSDKPLDAVELKELRWALERQRAAARFRRYARGRVTAATGALALVWVLVQMYDKVITWLRPH
jgi:hypothetical protein